MKPPWSKLRLKAGMWALEVPAPVGTLTNQTPQPPGECLRWSGSLLTLSGRIPRCSGRNPIISGMIPRHSGRFLSNSGRFLNTSGSILHTSGRFLNTSGSVLNTSGSVLPCSEWFLKWWGGSLETPARSGNLPISGPNESDCGGHGRANPKWTQARLKEVRRRGLDAEGGAEMSRGLRRNATIPPEIRSRSSCAPAGRGNGLGTSRRWMLAPVQDVGECSFGVRHPFGMLREEARA